MRNIKKYDKFLEIKKELDGSKKIIRKSPFNSRRAHDILDIKNQYLGSYEWIMKKLILMDNQRFSIISDALRNNDKIRKQKQDDRISRDIADFFEAAGSSIIT